MVRHRKGSVADFINLVLLFVSVRNKNTKPTHLNQTYSVVLYPSNNLHNRKHHINKVKNDIEKKKLIP
uniref:Uncharacterized protein n=1 Tax=Octopus bimaculoides TaxID=37653 RepID=A0A0L8FND5_OCTBM